MTQAATASLETVSVILLPFFWEWEQALSIGDQGAQWNRVIAKMQSFVLDRRRRRQECVVFAVRCSLTHNFCVPARTDNVT